jgi:hypothetical protein
MYREVSTFAKHIIALTYEEIGAIQFFPFNYQFFSRCIVIGYQSSRLVIV